MATNDANRLNDLLSAFNNIAISLRLIRNRLWHLHRQTSYVKLRFSPNGVFTGASDKWRDDVPENELVEIRSDCKMLPQHVGALYEAKTEAITAMESIPAPLAAMLDRLAGNKPWRAMVLRDCIDLLTTWPGQFSIIPEQVNALLDMAEKHSPFDTWDRYVELVNGYRREVYAIRVEIGGSDPVTQGNGVPNALASDNPEWAGESGKLMFRDVELCEVAGRAKNLRAILDAFEMQQWTRRIDDPLSQLDDPQRLADAVSALNGKQRAIRFTRDGTGQGVRWEPVE